MLMPIIAFVNLCQYDLSCLKVMPSSVLVLNAFSMFWYQTMDAIDGKQARKINNCSPLGQILDHNFD
jgi:phosphatidylglycerophosphate synthase